MSVKSGRRGRSAAALLTAMIVIALTGCGNLNLVGIAPPGAFDEVKDMAYEIQVANVGEVVHEDRDGGDYPGVGPTLTYIIEGDEALELLTQNLNKAGYEPSADSDAGWIYWDRERENGNFQVISVRAVTAGDQVLTGNGLRDAAAAGITVSLTA